MSGAAPTSTSAPSRKPVNLSIDAQLLREARAHGINVSAFLEQALAAELKQLRRLRWLAENGAATNAYNEDVRRHSAFRSRIQLPGR
ncbi:MAG: type II toxin-antitoxin system CcdA family antitoxin [Steroidobacteraceae bacterium]